MQPKKPKIWTIKWTWDLFSPSLSHKWKKTPTKQNKRIMPYDKISLKQGRQIWYFYCFHLLLSPVFLGLHQSLKKQTVLPVSFHQRTPTHEKLSFKKNACLWFVHFHTRLEIHLITFSTCCFSIQLGIKKYVFVLGLSVTTYPTVL